MVLGPALGCTLIAVALVLWGRHRASRQRVPPFVLRAVDRARDVLEARHPDVRWRGFVAGSLSAVLEIQGQETVVPLHRLLRQYEAFPEALGALVDRLVAEVRGDALDHPDLHPFAEVASAVLPQVRTTAWVDAHGRFGDSALVSRPLGADLAICYVIDDEHAMVFVCHRHLAQWGRSAEDVHRLALTNLTRLPDARVPTPALRAGPVVCQHGDGYDAARLLLVDPAGADGLLVALPDRDLLWLGRSDDLADLTARIAAQRARSAHPISERVYVLRAGRIEAVSAACP